MRVTVNGRPRGWYDAGKAQAWEHAGQVLEHTAAGEWMTRDAGAPTADVATAQAARGWLARAGLSTAPVDKAVPARARRTRMGRPQTGTKVEVRLPDEVIAALDRIAAGEGTTRSEVIRRALADRVDLRAGGLDEWLLARAERAPFQPGGPAQELQVWRVVQRLELAAVGFTVPQLCLVADVLNGPVVTAAYGSVTASTVGAEVTRIPGVYGSKWGVDEGELMARLAGVGPAADYALRQAIADFWDAPDSDSSDPRMWAELGFTVVAEVE